MTRRAGLQALAAQARIEEELLAERDLRRRHRIVGGTAMGS
jgi:hypothetical protein